MQFTTNTKQLKTNIVSWGKRRKAVAEDLHTLAVSCIVHVLEHGDTTLINMLDEQCRDGLDSKGKTASALHLTGLRRYFDKFGPVTWTRADKATGKPEHFAYAKAKAETMKQAYAADTEAYVSNLMAEPFWKLVPQPEFDGFNLSAIIKAAIQRADKVRTDPTKATHDKNDFSMLDQLKALYASASGKMATNKPSRASTSVEVTAIH